MPIVKEIDITKWNPTDWRFLLSIFLVMVVVLLLWSGANWAVGAVKSKLPTPTKAEAEEPTL